MKIFRTILTLIITSFLITSCGNKEHKTTSVKKTPIAVTINSVTTDNSNPFITVSGKIEASKSANISTRMMGFITKIKAKVGSKVRKGQLLVSINNTDLQAKLAQVNANITKAQVGVTNAEKDYNRFKALFVDQSASQKEVDDMTAHYEMAKAGLEAAKQMKNEVNAQFSYANLRAPFSGIITNKFVEVGDMANPGMPLLAIESPNNFDVTAMVPENEISKIKYDTKVTVFVKSMNETITGKVSEISTSALNTGGQYIVKISLEKTKIKILSGMFATVQFPVEKSATPTKSEKLMLPLSALVKKGSLKGIYTISEQNTAILRWLRLGKTYGDKIEVLSGLTTEEKYIVSSEGKLYNGATISVK